MRNLLQYLQINENAGKQSQNTSVNENVDKQSQNKSIKMFVVTD